MIERYLDYIQFSAIINEETCKHEKYEIVPPLPFYSHGYRDPFGFRIYYGNPNSKKALFIASGKQLGNMRSLGRLDAEILQWALKIGATFSRIDLAVTEWVEDTLITLEDITLWYLRGLIDSSLVLGGLKEISTYSGDESRYQETLYIGDLSKRGKKGIFRAYDKGIELDIGKYLVTRLEYEDRGEKAHNTALRIAETNDIAGNFKARFNVRDTQFHRLMDADTVDISRGEAKLDKEKSDENDARWIWLTKQVAPALRKAIETDRELGLGDARLKHFLGKSGIS